MSCTDKQKYIDIKHFLAVGMLVYMYACRDKERKAGRDGFVDSYRQRNAYSVRQDGSQKEGRESPRKAKSMTAVDLAVRKEQEQKEFSRRLKCIEVSFA